MPGNTHACCNPDGTLIKSLTPAVGSKRQLKTREFSAISGLAGRVGIAPTCITWALKLTLLALEIVERRQQLKTTLVRLHKLFFGGAENKQRGLKRKHRRAYEELLDLCKEALGVKGSAPCAMRL